MNSEINWWGSKLGEDLSNDLEEFELEEDQITDDNSYTEEIEAE